MKYIVGVDIGGTFTDCVAMDEDGAVTLGKALSTPNDFAMGALDAVGDAARNLGLGGENELLSATQFFFHACTVADNTLITRAGPKTGLLTTQGFGDTLLIMRGRTTEGLTESDAFRASTQSKPDPIVPRSLIEEVGERIDYKGAVLIRLEAEEIARSVRSLARPGRRVDRHRALVVAYERRARAGIGRLPQSKLSIHLFESFERSGAVPRRIRAHGDDRLQRLRRAKDRCLSPGLR